MKLEYANLICPKCGSGNYMRHLVGKNVGELNVKCINCNSYFKSSELYRMTGKAEPKQLTNADRIRQMTDEELAKEVLCEERWFDEKEALKWLKSPADGII